MSLGNTVIIIIIIIIIITGFLFNAALTISGSIQPKS